MTTRLTQESRKNAVRKLTAKAYDKKDAVLAKESSDMFDKLVKDYHRHCATAMSKLPPGAFRLQSSIYIKFRNDKKLTLSQTKSTHDGRPVFNSFPSSKHYDPVSFDSLSKELSPVFREELLAFQKKVAEYEADKKRFEEGVTAMLASVTTYKKLYEVWPELNAVVPLIEVPEGAMGKQLAPDTSFLNQQLGIKNAAVPLK